MKPDIDPMGKNASNADSVTWYPPKFVFEDSGASAGSQNVNVGQDESRIPVAIGIEFPEKGGVLIHYAGKKEPKKGFPYKSAALGVNAVKRSLKCLAMFLTGLPRNLFRGRVVRSAMECFTEFSDHVLSGHSAYWKPEYLSDMVREVWREGMAMSSDDAERRFVKTVCSVLEFEDAYRWFVQDVLSLLDMKKFMDDPSKEVRRTFKTAAGRGEGTREKFEKMGLLVSLALHVPSVRRTAKRFFAEVDMEKLYLDEKDWYWCLSWDGYDFGGYDFPTRMLLREKIDAKWRSDGGTHMDAEGKRFYNEP